MTATRSLFTPLVVLSLLALVAPLGALAANDVGQPDDLFALVTPRHASLVDGGVLVEAVDNLYLFDFTLHHQDGSPFRVREYMVDVNTANEDGAPVLVWTERVSLPTAQSSGTVRVPAGALHFRDVPLNGVTLTILGVYDEDRVSLLDGHLPSSSFSLAANELAAQGRWADAEQAGEGFTPIFITNAQLDGLVDAGNPVLNPGFEAGGADFQAPLGPVAFRSGIPPWFLTLYKPSGGATLPNSTYGLGAADGVAGSYVAIRYEPGDDGQNLGLGQFLTVPDQGAWKGTDATRIRFDVSVVDEAGVMPNFRLAANMFYEGSPSSAQPTPNVDGATVPTDGKWRRVTVHWGPQLDGMTLKQFYVNFASGTSYSGASGFHPDARPVVRIDNVVIDGVRLVQDTSPRNDLNDGYSAFVLPTQERIVGGEEATQSLVSLANGETAYVYDLAVMDYTDVKPREVDLTSQSLTFRLIDEASGTAGDPTQAKAFQVSGAAGASGFYRTLAGDGSVSPRVLVTVDPDAIRDSSLGGTTGLLVPHLYATVPLGAGYTDTFGMAATPAAGYYSPARNQLMGHGIADQLDYAFAPMRLTGQVGASLASDAVLTLTCPGATSGRACAADPNPVLEARLSTPSRVVEELPVTLVSAAQPTLVLGSGVVTTPGGVVRFTLTAAQVDQLESLGDLGVMALTAGGAFTRAVDGPAENGANLVQLDNLLPTADFTMSAASPVTRATSVTLTDRSADTDGTYTREWTVRFVRDDTPDEVTVSAVNPVATGTGPTLSFSVPDDGEYEVELTVRDNDGAAATKTVALSAVNLAPTAGLSGPAAVPGGATVVFADASRDTDGRVTLREADLGEGWVPVTLTAGAFALTAPGDEGPVTVQYRVTDDDGAVHQASVAFVVDDTAPATTVTPPAAVPSGWHAAPPSFAVTRADTGGSGLRETRVVDNLAVRTFAGGDAFSYVVATDGAHTIQFRSVDNAGNVEDASVYQVKVDTVPPIVALTNPTLGPLAGHALAGETLTLTASAADATSGVARVAFYAGAELLGVDADGADGWSFAWDTTGMESGLYEVSAIATDAAGHTAQSDRLTYLVFAVPPVPAP